MSFTTDAGPSGQYEIFTMDPDGSNVTLLASNNRSDQDARWSADGTKLVFNSCRYSTTTSCLREVYSMNADGTGITRLTYDSPAESIWPEWSPDGGKIVFMSDLGQAQGEFSIYSINADGSNRTRLTSGAAEWWPSWSPDGTKIAFSKYVNGDWQIYTMNPDGTNQTALTNESVPPSPIPPSAMATEFPKWSPDGGKIVFGKPRMITPSHYNEQIWVMNADGTNQTRLTNNDANDGSAVFSPDGTKIVFATDRNDPEGRGDIWVMNADGTNQRPLTSYRGNEERSPDWQPIPINAYPRPKGATPMKAFLVPAYEQCTAPDRTHGAPLSFGSCSSPQQTSSYLTVGTPDANGLAPSSRGYVQYTTVVGNPSTPANEADLHIDVSIVGVLNKSGLSPYSGELSADAGLRITDKLNTPTPSGPGAGTVQDTSFPVTVPCSSSTCGVSTTANALVPGAVLEGKRAIWQLDQVKVYDGGSDGLASTTAGNTLFMDEGIFVP